MPGESPGTNVPGVLQDPEPFGSGLSAPQVPAGAMPRLCPACRAPWPAAHPGDAPPAFCPHCGAAAVARARRLPAADPYDSGHEPPAAPREGPALPAIVAVFMVVTLLLAGVGMVVFLLTEADRPPPPLVAQPLVAQPLAAPPVIAPPKPGATVIDRVKEATVKVRASGPGPFDQSTGSGFFAGAPGQILTNYHVVSGEARRPGFPFPVGLGGPSRVTVVVRSGERGEKELGARVVRTSSEEDLALLEVPAGPDLPPPLPLGRAADLRETDDLLIFGFPLGDQLGPNVSVNKTTVSSLRRRAGELHRVQVAGGMHPGNSGGPVTDPAGAVVGISVSVVRDTQIHFAIPAETASKFFAGALPAPPAPPPVAAPVPPAPAPRPSRPGADGVTHVGPGATAVATNHLAARMARGATQRLSGKPGEWLRGAAFRVAKVGNFPFDAITAVRPLYATEKDERDGDWAAMPGRPFFPFGEPREVVLEAKPGYAVAGLSAQFFHGPNRVRLLFARVKGDGLDLADAYESEWTGPAGVGGGRAATLEPGPTRPAALLVNGDGGELQGIGLSTLAK